MTNQEKNVPELRFPEFDGEWQEKKLGDIAIIKGRLGWKGLKNEEYVENGYAYLVAGRHIKNGIIDWHSADQINKFRYDESPEISLEKNDIIFSKDGSLGNPAIIQSMLKPATINGTMMLVRVQAQKLNPNFFYQILLNDHFKRLIHLKVSGSSIPHLFQADMKEFTIKTTKINEQQKIGEFFSKLDRQIELEEQKLAKLEEQKKGYMQKIFSQELRFKDKNGNEYPKWEVIKLKDILSERKEYASKIGNYPHATLSTSGISLKSDRYNRDFLVKDKNKKYKVTIMNDICYNPANLKFGVITRNHIGSVIFSPIYITFEVNNAHSPLFIELLVTRNDFINRVRKYEEGTVYERMAVKPEDFLNYETKIPCLEEQEKIGDFFSKLDKVINKQRQKIDELKLLKQGLLQKMFV
ncbi:restriction endonuclease subunit S [Staphylococcus equorum]|uniref:restriction endonuclease subunit S n=1 Tax=Staphylococcus equorum TaxID=246432 RepID=UPI002DB89947|nr:restriction endonuclease subunit S [Staphylococcus equorum]MEB7794717.1 restriction endonuclease subunit S [Staphylococcus equorum]